MAKNNGNQRNSNTADSSEAPKTTSEANSKDKDKNKARKKS